MRDVQSLRSALALPSARMSRRPRRRRHSFGVGTPGPSRALQVHDLARGLARPPLRSSEPRRDPGGDSAPRHAGSGRWKAAECENDMRLFRAPASWDVRAACSDSWTTVGSAGESEVDEDAGGGRRWKGSRRAAGRHAFLCGVKRARCSPLPTTLHEGQPMPHR